MDLKTEPKFCFVIFSLSMCCVDTRNEVNIGLAESVYSTNTHSCKWIILYRMQQLKVTWGKEVSEKERERERERERESE